MTSLPEFLQALTAVHRADFAAAARLRGTGRPVVSNESLTPLVPADDSPGSAAAVAQWDAVVGLVAAPGPRNGRLRRLRLLVLRGDRRERAASRAVPGRRHARPARLRAVGRGPGRVLDRLAHELPGKSLVVAELGYGGTDDDARVDYLTEALGHVHKARADGIDVAGVFLWTGIDNYEWLAGDSVPSACSTVTAAPP
ncbi:family 1 glycosylhydrolase [Luedemannella flava]